MTEEDKRYKFYPLNGLDMASLGNTVGAVADKVKTIHNLQPKLIVLTQTSSIPYGYILKEAYRTAFPNDKQPTFITIDPKSARHIYDNNDSLRQKFKDIEAERMAKKISLYNVSNSDKVMLLDEQYNDDPKRFENPRCTAGIAKSILINALNQVNAHPTLNTGFIAHKIRDTGRILGRTFDGCKRDGDEVFCSGICGWTNEWKDNSNRASRYSGKEERKISRENIAILKRFGKNIGSMLNDPSKLFQYQSNLDTLFRLGITSEGDYKQKLPVRPEEVDFDYITPELLEASEWNRRNRLWKNLEQAVSSATVVMAILGSIFFLSSNITGKAIADMTTKTTSFVGAGLLIIGLVAGFFWLRSRKK
jgi:hypothetical protein